MRAADHLAHFGLHFIGNRATNDSETNVFYAVCRMVRDFLGIEANLLGTLPESVFNRRKIWTQTPGSQDWQNRTLAALGAEAGDSWQALGEVFGDGLEAFYNIAITRAAKLTFDFQWVGAPSKTTDDAIVLGSRLQLSF